MSGQIYPGTALPKQNSVVENRIAILDLLNKINLEAKKLYNLLQLVTQDLTPGATPTFSDLILTSLTASLPVVTDATKKLVSLVYTGAVSFRANLGLEPANSPTFTNLTLSGLSASLALVTNASKQLVSLAYTGAVSLRANLALETTDSPTFTGLTLSGLTASLALVTNASKQLTSLAYTGVTSLRANLGLETTDSPTFAGLTDTGLTASQPTITDGSKKLASIAYTGATSLRANLALETTDSPTFAGLTDSGLTASQPVITDGSKKLASIAYTGATSLRKNLGLETSDSPTFTGATISGLTASLPVVSDGAKALVSLAYTGATSFRKNLGLEPTDSPTFAGETLGGDLTFTGSARRIKADFSNATLANRTFFQTSTANSVTSVGIIPTGTGANAISALLLANTTDPDNADILQLVLRPTRATIDVTKTGTGTTRDLEFSIDNVTKATLKTTGSFVLNSGALGTTATDGFLYIATCAGAPTGAPTAFTGRVAMVYDTTNNKLYVHNGAWKSVALV